MMVNNTFFFVSAETGQIALVIWLGWLGDTRASHNGKYPRKRRPLRKLPVATLEASHAIYFERKLCELCRLSERKIVDKVCRLGIQPLSTWGEGLSTRGRKGCRLEGKVCRLGGKFVDSEGGCLSILRVKTPKVDKLSGKVCRLSGKVCRPSGKV